MSLYYCAFGRAAAGITINREARGRGSGCRAGGGSMVGPQLLHPARCCQLGAPLGALTAIRAGAGLCRRGILGRDPPAGVMLQQAGLRPLPWVGSWPLLELGCGGGEQPGLPVPPTPLPSLLAPCCPHGSVCPGSAQTPLALLLLARGCAAAARPPRPLPGPAFEAGLLAEVGIALMAFLPPSSSTNAFSPPLRSPSPIPLFPAAKSIAAGGGWEGRDKNKREF